MSKAGININILIIMWWMLVGTPQDKVTKIFWMVLIGLEVLLCIYTMMRKRFKRKEGDS